MTCLFFLCALFFPAHSRDVHEIAVVTFATSTQGLAKCQHGTIWNLNCELKYVGTGL